jgi:hypothetical protein
MPIEIPDQLSFLSDLYVEDAEDACLLTQYPSSNSDETIFQNKSQFIIHDPFPPPPRELLQSLGPHHLMCCWGHSLPVTSEVAPPKLLLDHWQRVFGSDGCPAWRKPNNDDRYITLFPHQSLPLRQQVVDPTINYALHSKEVIEKIKCAQADVLDSVRPPCIVKLSHGYAGLGNFLIRNQDDEQKMRTELERNWPDSTIVINSVIENIVGDFGVQFYLKRDGSIVWLGLTEQHFNESKRWCGGTFSNHLQTELIEPFESIVSATAEYLTSQGYFGVVGIDILRNESGECFLVDVNPRLTGITPFLMASRIFFKSDAFTEGVYRASFRYDGGMAALIEAAESHSDCRVLILSAIEDSSDDKTTTICHISVSSDSQARNQNVLSNLEMATA